MKKIIPFFVMFVVLLTFVQPVKSQEEIRGKALYAELFGPGVLFSFNFDSRFKAGEQLGFGYRLGVGFGVADFAKETIDEWGYEYYESTEYRSYYTIPVGLNYILGKKNSPHTFEVGAGATFLTRKVSLYCYDVKTPGYFTGHLSLMYRRVTDGGFLFRAGFTPIIGTSGDLFPIPTIGIGYSF